MSQIKRNRKKVAYFMAIPENDFSDAMLKGITKAVKEIDADLIVFPMDLFDEPTEEERADRYRYQYNRLAEFINAKAFDAVFLEYGTIFSTLTYAEKLKYLGLIREDVPVILLSEDMDRYRSFCMDNMAGFRELIDHMLTAHDCKQVGYISGPKDNHDAIERLGVFREVMAEHGREVDEDLIIYGNFSQYMRKEIDQFLRDHPEIDTLISANDGMAISAYIALKAQGRKIGEEIRVTGFDDIPPSLLMEPSLTTVRADAERLAYEAVMSVYRDGGDDWAVEKITPGRWLVPTRMVVRESCGCCQEFGGVEYHPLYENMSNWRDITRDRLVAEDQRKSFEHELANVMNDLVFFHEGEQALYAAVLGFFKRLHFPSAFVFLHDEIINSVFEEQLPLPEDSLVAYYKNDGEIQTFDKGEHYYNMEDVYGDELLQFEERSDLVVFPIFFREGHYGYVITQTDTLQFQYVQQLVAQISNTLAIIHMMDQQTQITEQLELANESKSQFLANMSHEIRTPINAILGLNEMILREYQNPAINEYATDVKHAADALLSLVNDILDFSKIEAGKMTLVEGEYSLYTLLTDIVNLMRFRAEKKNLTLQLEYDESLPNLLYGDEARIRQVLLNLLSNAVKYTEKGGVTLRASGVLAEDALRLTIEVIDTGIGIKEEDIGHLYQKFERIEEKRNRSIEGTGLGINITVGLLSLMDSSLQVKSVYGEGSTFGFTVLQRITGEGTIGAQATKEQADKAAASSGKKKLGLKKKQSANQFRCENVRILLVDDNALNRKVIKGLLKNTGIEIDDVDNGYDCIAMAATNDYDMVLLDHMMPNMDGLETLAEMQRTIPEYENHEIPVVALTANAIMGAEERYLKAGFDAYLSKPVMPEALDEMLFRYIRKDKVKQ